jgi:hypothetical protein
MTRFAGAGAAAIVGAGALAVWWSRIPTARPDGATNPACGSQIVHRGVLAPGTAETFVVCLGRRVRATLRVENAQDETPHGGDLDCYVYGPRRNRVARDDDETDGCSLGWTTADSGDYFVEVANTGTAASEYHLRTP